MPVLDRTSAPFAVLLGSLVLFLCGVPPAARSPAATLGLQVLLTLVLLAALAIARAHARGAFGLGIAALALFWTWPFTGSRWHLLLALAGTLAFLSYATWVTVRHVARAGEVTIDVLFGATCGYLLLGISFVVAFGLAEAFSLDVMALEGTSDDSLTVGARFGELVYFSLVTLSTLGYGDIAPSGPGVRALAPLEAIIGQLYLAILIARLVALHVIRGSAPAAID